MQLLVDLLKSKNNIRIFAQISWSHRGSVLAKIDSKKPVIARERGHSKLPLQQTGTSKIHSTQLRHPGQFVKELYSRAKELYFRIDSDRVFDGAAAIAYYLFLAIFPAMIAFLSMLPYLPIENLHLAVMDFVRELWPGQAARAFEGVIAEVTLNKRGNLVSIGAFLTLWAASSGLYAVMQQMNLTYRVKETRPIWKLRLTAIALTLLFGCLVAGAFALIVFGGVLQGWLDRGNIMKGALIEVFALFRWLTIASLMLTGFALVYRWGPNIKQRFQILSPGSIAAVILLALASIGFRVYVENFGDYAATYGSIGAVIVLLLWLYFAGLSILIGSEINSMQLGHKSNGAT